MKALLVDDQPEFRKSLRDLLASVPGFEIVGEAGDGKEAVALALESRPDIILMDIRMPRMDGIAATTAIRKVWAAARILVLTTFDDDRLIQEAIAAGAAGYLLKGTPLDDFVAILRLATKGYIAIGRGNVQRPLGDYDNLRERAERLNERERQIWALIGGGHTNRDIAQRLFLTEGTVRTTLPQCYQPFRSGTGRRRRFFGDIFRPSPERLIPHNC
ncbi:MAG TPA: response regulator transcription factor [Candidatus Tumulicola sp.]|jgi:DNA-binding NarL/FixJ family response regulator